MHIEIKEKMTLSEILNYFDMMDQGLIDPTIEEMEEIGLKASEKVDGYKNFMNRCETEIRHLSARASEFLDAASSVKKTHDKIKQMMIFFMERSFKDQCKKAGIKPDAKEAKKFAKLTGIDWKVTLSIRKNSKMVPTEHLPDPNSTLYFSMKDYIKRSYSFDNEAVKNNLKSEKPDAKLAAWFKLEDSNSLRWSINKGVEK